jgi:NAD(P)-dependent dehydrogenase (short-subunit alcohol dehydrogenase family)
LHQEKIMNRFTGKVAVITGGNSGIGLATAKRLQSEGAKVVIVGRDPATLTAAGREHGFIVVQADVGKVPEIERMYREISEKVGKIDLLFANAGIYKAAALADTSEEFFDETVDINLKGLFFTVQKALPLLNDGAAVVLNSSTVTQKGWPGIAVYSATKAAVRSLARTFAAELLPRRIRVNAVSPGVTFTPIFGRLGLDAEQLKATAEGLMKMVPAGRFATPEDIAAGVAYLGSEDAAYVIGAELTIDGGVSQL